VRWGTVFICAQDDPSFLGATGAARGSVLHYAEHVKNEAIEALNEDEAILVLKSAANDARSDARRQLGRLTISYDNTQTKHGVSVWCESEAKKFELEFIREHDADHDTTVEFLRRAKE
jgi:hypothetical protein